MIREINDNKERAREREREGGKEIHTKSGKEKKTNDIVNIIDRVARNLSPYYCPNILRYLLCI